MLLLAVHLGRRRGALVAGRARVASSTRSASVPQQMRDVLAKSDDVKRIAKKHMRARDMLFLGRGTGFPIALEGALKLKEISYIHAEGYAAGEMKHGPIALIDEEMPVVVVVPEGRALREDALEHAGGAARARASSSRSAREGDADVRALLSERDDRAVAPAATSPSPTSSRCPSPSRRCCPLLTVLPLQLLAYHMADLKGTDVDQPRNLAKTVTVEVEAAMTGARGRPGIGVRRRWPPSSSATGRTGAAIAAACAPSCRRHPAAAAGDGVVLEARAPGARGPGPRGRPATSSSRP